MPQDRRTRARIFSILAVSLGIFAVGLLLLLIWVEYQIQLAHELSFVLIPISIVVLVYEMILRFEWIDLIREAVEEETFAKAGGEKLYDCLPHDDILDDISRASNTEICLMGTYFPMLSNEPSRVRWRKGIEDALKRGCRVKVLIMESSNEKYINDRARQLGLDPDGIDSDLLKSGREKSKQAFQDLKQKLEDKDKVEIRLFTEYPVGPVYIIGDTLYQGFYLPNKWASDSPLIKANIKHGGALSKFAEVFHEIWRKRSNAKEKDEK